MTKKKRSKSRPAAEPVKVSIMFALSAADEATIRMRPRLSLQAIVDGAGSTIHLADMMTRLNVGKIMAERHFNNLDASEEVCLGLASVLLIDARRTRVGKIGATVEERQQISRAFDVVDALQDNVTRREHLAAVRYVQYPPKTAVVHHGMRAAA